MIIKTLTMADNEVYYALFLRGLREHPYQFRVTPADVENLPVPMETQQERDFTLGAWEGADLVGIVSVTCETRFRLRHKALLHRMYVSADVAGRGIGRSLLQEAVARCENTPGLEQVILTLVGENERARALYESEGFVVFAREPKALRFDTSYSDELQMVRFHATMQDAATLSGTISR